MHVAQMLRWVLLAIQGLLIMPILYLTVLSFSAIRTARRRRRTAKDTTGVGAPPVNFAILIPAHDEEMVLGALLDSLSRAKVGTAHRVPPALRLRCQFGDALVGIAPIEAAVIADDGFNVVLRQLFQRFCRKLRIEIEGA